MPRLTPLPERLRYLEAFRKQIAKLNLEEIGESMDLSLLNKLLLERINGMPINEGKEKLKADYEILGKWVLSPGLKDNGGMIFLQGYLMALPELVERLLEERDEPESPKKEIQMDFPQEARTKRMRGGLLKATWLRTTVFLLPCDRKDRDYQIKEFHQGP